MEDDKFITRDRLNEIIEESIKQFNESQIKTKRPRRNHQEEMLQYLASGPMTCMSLKRLMKCSDSVFCDRADKLIQAGLIKKERSGKCVMYSLINERNN